jgi:DNA repair protein RecN (Recombination protein N)
LGPGGCDEIEFFLSTIPDRPLRPLRDVASGGEVSRIMLALKHILGRAHTVPTMIFDEIDIGIGGRTAETVAERLKNLSKEKQVVCITHLPQIAARADRNLRVTKSDVHGTQKAAVEYLAGKDREDEMVRMLGGDEASRRYARELLRGSKEGKKQ